MLSKWSITEEGSFLHNGLPVWDRPWQIVHIDDHKLYTEGVRLSLLPFFPAAEITTIRHGDEGMRFLQEGLEKGLRVDLVITDINHPGLSGHELVKTFRQLEKIHNVNPVPLIILSMCDTEKIVEWMGREADTTTRYLSKSIEIQDLVDVFEELLYRS